LPTRSGRYERVDCISLSLSAFPSPLRYLRSRFSRSVHCIRFLWFPHLNNPNSSHLQPLFRLQKKALKIITHSPPRTHTYSLFNKFKILNIFNIYKYQVSCFVFLHMQNLLPSPLSSLFVLNSDCHQYLTRQKDNLHLHTHKYSFSLRVQGTQIWNDIPLSLRNSLTLSSYKHKLRDYFQSSLN